MRVYISAYIDRQIDRQIDGQIARQTDRQIDEWIDGQMDRYASGLSLFQAFGTDARIYFVSLCLELTTSLDDAAALNKALVCNIVIYIF